MLLLTLGFTHWVYWHGIASPAWSRRPRVALAVALAHAGLHPLGVLAWGALAVALGLADHTGGLLLPTLGFFYWVRRIWARWPGRPATGRDSRQGPARPPCHSYLWSRRPRVALAVALAHAGLHPLGVLAWDRIPSMSLLLAAHGPADRSGGSRLGLVWGAASSGPAGREDPWVIVLLSFLRWPTCMTRI